MARVELEEILTFLRLEQEDLDLLSQLRETIEKNADQFVDEFYRHLLQFPPTQHLLRHEGVRERLRTAQRKYLLSLVDPVIDEAYADSRRTIGATHERVGLATRYYFGAYSLYFNLLMPLVSAHVGHNTARHEMMLGALVKRLLLDAELAISQYVDRREEDLNRLNTDLARASQTLTQEMRSTTRDLRRSEERAHAAERLASVATLVTGLAHEIGTPMGVLRGHAEALEGSVQGDRAAWRLQMIIEQTDRITNIIQSLLDMARPKESLRVPLDLNEVAETSLAFLAEKCKRRAVEVESALDSHPTVLGDPEKLQQVFLNLLINAIDAMPGGGVLYVRTGRSEDGNAEIRIRDDGVGLDAAHLDSIFEPFFTTKAAGHGNGLGLVVVKGIVEEHGGHIEVLSQPGTGTEFVVRLPAI